MTRIAHLSDLHLLEPAVRARRGGDWFRVHYLSLRRSIDYVARRARAEQALRAAADHGFDHLVITGDLTEDGALVQYEVLADVLEASGIPPERITLLPGNHDAYGTAVPWDIAVQGPLARWAGTSREGSAAWLDDCVIVPVSSAVPQTFLRSSGRVESHALDHVGAIAGREPGRPVVIAQHHPPYAVMHQWVHGLLNHEEVTGLLEARDNVSVLHGHIHRRKERGLVVGGPLRIFSPYAVADNATPLRMYDVVDGLLRPLAPLAPRPDPLGAVVRDVEAMGGVVLRDVGAFGELVRRDVEHLGEALLHDVEHLGESLLHDVEHLGDAIRAEEPRPGIRRS
ncbi:MAG: metallophosphoesterase [Pseudomonadota bacterium]|nr:metallophosphoesterase [Pseudomonadota bacterium]